MLDEIKIEEKSPLSDQVSFSAPKLPMGPLPKIEQNLKNPILDVSKILETLKGFNKNPTVLKPSLQNNPQLPSSINLFPSRGTQIEPILLSPLPQNE